MKSNFFIRKAVVVWLHGYMDQNEQILKKKYHRQGGIFPHALFNWLATRYSDGTGDILSLVHVPFKI